MHQRQKRENNIFQHQFEQMLEEKEQMDKKIEEETLQRRIKKLEEIVENIKNISEEEKKTFL